MKDEEDSMSPFTPEQEDRIRAILVEVLADHPTLARAIWPTIELQIDSELTADLARIGISKPNDSPASEA
jgi:hypothetical protein